MSELCVSEVIHREIIIPNCPACKNKLNGPTITDKLETSGLYFCTNCNKTFRPIFEIKFKRFEEIKNGN